MMCVCAACALLIDMNLISVIVRGADCACVPNLRRSPCALCACVALIVDRPDCLIVECGYYCCDCGCAVYRVAGDVDISGVAVVTDCERCCGL